MEGYYKTTHVFTRRAYCWCPSKNTVGICRQISIKTPNKRKFVGVGLALIHADGRTNVQKQRVAIRIFFGATEPINFSEQHLLYWQEIGVVTEKLK
jgi:hypothetical protein